MAEAALNVNIDGEGRGLEAETRRLERSIRDLRGSIDRTKRSASGLENQSDRTSRSMAGMERAARRASQILVTAVAAGLALSTREALKFSGAMDEVSTLLGGDVRRQTANLSEEVKRLSAQFGQAPVDQARALYQIISAGASDAASQVEILTVANKLAVGGVTEVSVAADGLTSILNAYGLGADSATRVSDAMFTAMKAGKTTIGELSTSIGQLAPITSQAGVSLEEMLGVVAALTKSGLSTAESVTAVRAAITAILKPTEEASKLAKQLNIDFSASALASRGFAGIMEEVAAATGGSTEAIVQLFGNVRAMPAVLAAAGSGAEDLANILAAMDDKVGATDEAFNRLNEGAAQQVKVLFSNLAVAAIDLGQDILDPLVPALTKLNENFEAAKEAGLRFSRVLLGILVNPALLSREIILLIDRLKGSGDAADEAGASLERHKLNVELLTLSLGDLNNKTRQLTILNKEESTAFETLRSQLLPVQALSEKYQRDKALLVKASKSETLATFDLSKALAALDKAYAENLASLTGVTKEHQAEIDLLDKVRDRLDPVAAETRRYTDELRELTSTTVFANLTGEEQRELLQSLRIEYDRNRQALEELATQAGRSADAADPFAAAWQDAISRIDTAFEDAFKGAFDSFTDFAGKLLDGFKQLGAAILNSTITRPITGLFAGAFGGSAAAGVGSAISPAGGPSGLLGLLLGGAAGLGGGVSGVLGRLATTFPGLSGVLGTGVTNLAGAGGLFGLSGNAALGVGSLLSLGGGFAGSALSSSLFGSRENATGLGGLVGGLAGTFGIPIPVLGTALGSFLGDALDKLLGGSDFSGKRVTLGVNVGQQPGGGAPDRTAFGASGLAFQQFTRRADTFGAQNVAQELFDQFLALDQTLTTLTEAAGATVNLAGVTLRNPTPRAGASPGFFGSFAKGEINEADIARAADDFVRAWLTEVNDQLPKRTRQILAGVDQTAQALVEALGIATQIDQLLNLDVVKETRDALDALGQGNQALFDAYDRQNEIVLDLAGNLDGSVEGLRTLTEALTNQKLIAAQLALQYQQVGDQISATFGSAIDQIRESLLSDEELYAARREQIATLTAELAQAVDPAQIQSLTAQIDQLARGAFGILDESQQQSLAGEFLAFLTRAEVLAQRQVEAGLAQLATRETGISGAVDLELAGQTFQSSTQSFASSVTRMEDVVARFEVLSALGDLRFGEINA